MALLIDAPSFTANEVYEIQATDAVEGAAIGASFGGLGLSNHPHQQLANRTAFIKQRQDTNIGNIAALQSFTALFKGLISANGYAQVPVRGRQSRVDHCDGAVGRAVPVRWFGGQSDIRDYMAAALSQ